MLRLIGFFLLLLMHGNTPAVFGPILRFLFGESRQNLGVILTAFLELFHLTHVNISLKVPGKSGEITYRCFAGVEQLMWRSIRNVQNRPRKKIVALIIENHKSFAALDINRFLAVKVFSGMPAHRNLRAHETAAPGGKSSFRRDHQCRFVILGRAHPFKILTTRHSRRFINYFVVVF